jgi:NADH dehydrogenase
VRKAVKASGSLSGPRIFTQGLTHMNIPESNLPRIVVIGCGFAGLKFTKKLDTSKYQVVLLDKNNYHTFQPLMYQVATAGLEPDSIVYPIRKVFGGKQNFYFRLAEVQRVDTVEKRVYMDVGVLTYDHLILATGATSNFFGMKDIEEHSLPMKSLTESLDLRSSILQKFEAALNTNNLEEREALMNFVIVGAGATGVELAGALAELKKHVLPTDYPDLDVRRMQIHILEAGDRVLAGMSNNASTKSKEFLDKMGVNVWLNTAVKSYDGQVVQTEKTSMRCATLIWSAGVQGNPVPGIAVKLQRGNRVPVDAYGMVEGHEEIYALGDLAHMACEEYPKGHAMLASVAGQQGAWLAENFNLKSRDKATKEFQYSDQGTMATVGRNLAVVDMKRWKFSGLFAWLTWMFVHLMLLVDYRSRLIVFINWVWSYFKYDRGSRLIVRRK